MISSKLSFIKNYLILTITILSILGCSTYNKNLNGKYVNIENIYNDYYVFDKKNSLFTYFKNNKIGKGKMYFDKSTLFLKTDSFYKYNSLDIGYPEFTGSLSGDDTRGIIVIDKLFFQKFKKNHPTISLFFIGFNTSSFDKSKKGNPVLVLELKGGDNIYKTDSIDEIVHEFKIIGLHNKCLYPRWTKDCELFDISFETKVYLLMGGSLGPKVEISLDSIINKKLSEYRFIRAIDSFDSKKRFHFDGKTYEKIERLQD